MSDIHDVQQVTGAINKADLRKADLPKPQRIHENFKGQIDELNVLVGRFEAVLINLAGHGQDDGLKRDEDAPEPQGLFNIYLHHQRKERELSGRLMALASDIESTLGA